LPFKIVHDLSCHHIVVHADVRLQNCEQKTIKVGLGINNIRAIQENKHSNIILRSTACKG